MSWRLKVAVLFTSIVVLTHEGRVLRMTGGSAFANNAAPNAAASSTSLASTVAAPRRNEACPEGTLPDGDVCVHLALDESGPELLVAPGAHREKSGAWATYQQIPRLPDRPPSYDAYLYPIPPGLANGAAVVSGYDLDRPDGQQRRGQRLSHVGHGGVDLPQARGTRVSLLRLEHQSGEAEVLYTGPLFGTTVVTRHTLLENGVNRDYVVLFGHLESIAPSVHPGRAMADGEIIGTVGDSGSPGLVHLHYEVRRVRDGVDLRKVAAGPRLIAEDVSIVCDPRNVLPLRPL